jgi:hypothetical protein
MNMLFFMVALQTVCFLMYAFQVFGSALNYPMGDAASLMDLSNLFQITPFTALLGIGGAAAITIIGVLTRSGTYAVYSVLIFGIGAFFPIVQYFFLAVPNTIGALINGLGLDTSITNPLLVVLGVYVALWCSLYMFGLVFQRDIHQ